MEKIFYLGFIVNLTIASFLMLLALYYSVRMYLNVDPNKIRFLKLFPFLALWRGCYNNEGKVFFVKFYVFLFLSGVFLIIAIWLKRLNGVS